ncbi:hypothetical protein BJF90_42490 [Pseudonocardia sp. CNS-004]|nr:hypothetical protein BJF90_42490 [Pseudonocardia sp. CNS-004]
MITVADLLSRNAPAPLREGDPDTDGISVGALLRREGRAPRAADRPVQPRPRQQQAPSDDDDGRPDRRVLVRRGAIAAGTLLAAGSVVGATLFTDVVPTVNQRPPPVARTTAARTRARVCSTPKARSTPRPTPS